MSISANDFFQENDGSDSDTADDGDYRPISALSDEEDDPDDETPIRINGSDLIAHPGEFDSISFQNPSLLNSSNGSHPAENGISNLNLNDDDEEEEEEERMRRASESAISRAFREDESRRNAPLTPENSSRIINAMRGVSFHGFPPDWAGNVPEDQWLDQLQRLREPTTSQN
ncbi:uncharacterized protein LOC131253427 [Magnolia sinica]|uniref:uncharacterized protein LOC131253427 n=1 Tax=Magnolia sinica TaxID=86752 RepID=UPI0026583895|nr:uncharacterized protein LOC131253427 [Magnolia sinica]